MPEEKIDGLKSLRKQAYMQSRVPVKRLASIVGKMTSMSLAIGPVSRLRTRALYTTINSRRSWCDSVSLPQNAKEELEFWFRSINSLNGNGLTLVLQESCTQMLVITARGGYMVELGPEITHGQWSEAKALLSSTWRELKIM